MRLPRPILVIVITTLCVLSIFSYREHQIANLWRAQQSAEARVQPSMEATKAMQSRLDMKSKALEGLGLPRDEYMRRMDAEFKAASGELQRVHETGYKSPYNLDIGGQAQIP